MGMLPAWHQALRSTEVTHTLRPHPTFWLQRCSVLIIQGVQIIMLRACL
jgi:hypothetical protein